jgi:hypothetical protein
MCSAETHAASVTDFTLEESACLGAAPLGRAINDRIRDLIGAWAFGEYDFVCECDDELCFRSVRLTGRDFDAVRTQSGLAIVAAGHELPTDDVVVRAEAYVIVRRAESETSESESQAADEA